MDVADAYETLLSTNGASESALQTYLENHSELLPVSPFELGHGLRLDSFITKFQLDTTLITDFVFLTRNSDTWRVVLIEIEPANVPLYTRDIDSPQPTFKFSKRLAQIDRWKLFTSKHSAIIESHLKPLMKIAPGDYKLEFKYFLIVGRKATIENSTAKMMFRMKSDSETEVITRDSLISRFKNNPKRRRNILRMSGSHFTYKYLTCPCMYSFGTETPNDIKLAQRYRRRLERHGFEINKWEEGESLNSLGKVAPGSKMISSTDLDALHKRFHDDLLDRDLLDR